MAEENSFYKINDSDSIWWVENSEQKKDQFLFTFDKKKIFDLFFDYPDKLTKKQKELFDKENPFWCDFFNGNLKPLKGK